MFKALVVVMVLVVVGLGVYFLYFKNPVNTTFGKVTIGNKVFAVEVADTPYKKEQGLSNRNSIGLGTDGMLFVFDVPARYAFWMKDMRFVLDFVWIKDDRVVWVDSNVAPPKPGETLASFSPPEEVNYVLELPEGMVQKYGIDKGNIVKISLPDKK